jgi:subfamily B ATP-binding cassette protein MsbA
MHTFKRLTNYMKPYWWRIVIAALASAAFGGMNGAFAYLVEPLLKKIFMSKDMVIFSILPLGIIVLFLIRGFCRFTNDYFMRTAGQLAVQDVRNDIYRRNVYLGLGFFSRNQTGALMSRVLNDVSIMQEGVGNIITCVFRDGIGVISLLAVLFYRNWQLAIISFLVIPLTIYPAQLIGKKLKNIARASQDKMGEISSLLQETFTGIKVIKAFGLEHREIDRFATANWNYYLCVRKGIKYSNLSSPSMEVITSFGIATVIWVGGSKVMADQMSAAAFFSFLTAMALVYSPIKGLVGAYNEFQRCVGAGERVFEIIDVQPEIINSPTAITLKRATGRVEFKDVHFKFAEEFTLQGINLTAEKGEIIALVGPSGGGKTTLVSLIPRFYDVAAGRVTIDSHDVKDITLESLLRQIALVDQETILFNDTIANNIRYGKPDASEEEVEAASRAGFAHDFILEMPEGYATNIGDRGVRLSGGQRQRICIARAILKDAPILILDEATSALDTESEQMVQEALNNLMANRTTFVIAHRLSTILHADKIIVLDKGKIVERGSHSDLISSSGLYCKLHAMQFRNFEQPSEP